MEKRINTKVTNYIDNFKSEVKTYIKTNDNIPLTEKSDLLKFIYDFETLEINKQDFVKRKRSKSVVPFYSRCIAKKSSGEQCTRKKRNESSYCGTHDKNRPHGEINECDKEENILKKLKFGFKKLMVLYIILMEKIIFIELKIYYVIVKIQVSLLNT